MLSYQTLINLRLIAIHNIVNEDLESYVEKAYRHYSKTYFTALDEAKQKKTPHEVILILMEDELSELKVEELRDMQDELSTNPTLFPDRAYASAEVSDEAWIADQNRMLRQQEEKDAAKKAKAMEEVAKKTHEAIEKLTATIKKIPGTPTVIEAVKKN